MWGKLGYGALLTAEALTNLSISDYIAHPRYRPLHVAMCSELMQLALAEDVQPLGFNGYDPDAFISGDDAAIDATLRAMDEFNRGNAKSHSGIWRDIAVRKRKTEVPQQIGPAVARGQARGMAMPLTAKLIELIEDVEEGRREQCEDTADVLLEMVVGIEAKL